MEPILEVKALSHIYSAGTPFEHRALDNVSFLRGNNADKSK